MASKGVGMVRRMDELGRVVIPKEVRKTFHIGNHEPLEILVDGEDTIVLRKYHSRPDIEALAQEYAETMYKTLNQTVLVDDSQVIIAVSGLPKKEYLNKPVPDELILAGLTGLVDIQQNDQIKFAQCFIESFPLADGTHGRFMMLARNKGELGQAEIKTLQAAASFLGRWLEKNT